MKSQQLDIRLEVFGDNIHVTLSGNFFAEQIPNVRQKFEGFVQEGYHEYIVLLEDVELRSSDVMHFFLEILNTIQGRSAKLILIFQKPTIESFFSSYSNIFQCYSSIDSYQKSGFVNSLKRTGILYSRRTGLRISLPTAILISCLVAGWVLTLFTMIDSQENRLRNQEQKLNKLILSKDELVQRAQSLQKKLAPFQQMGLLKDSIAISDYKYESDWIDYLEKRSKK
jgi:anti-anti-sigma regulatory factor